MAFSTGFTASIRINRLAALLACCFAACGHAESIESQPLPAPRIDFSAPLPIGLAERLLEAQSPDLVAARLAEHAAAADRLAADRLPNPTVSLSAARYLPPYSYAPFPNYGFGASLDRVIGVSELIERGGKRALRQEAAENEVTAAGADVKDTLRKLRLALAQNYYSLAVAEQTERIAGVNLDLYRNSVAAMQLRLKAGDIAAADLAKMQVELGQAEIASNRAHAARLQAQKDLALLLGSDEQKIRTSVNWDLQQRLSLPSRTEPDFAKILDSRPDLAAAQARLDQAAASKKLALAQNDTDVTVGIQYERGPVGGNISTRNIGVNLSFPLQILYRNQGEIAQAEAARELAVAQLAKTRMSALAELRKAWSELEASAVRLQGYQGEIIPRSEQAATAAEFAYQHGSGSLLDLLDSRRTRFNLLLEALNARAEYEVAQWQWRSAAALEQLP